MDRDGNPGGVIQLELRRIPFVLLDIGDSMIKDVVNHQIALLNLGSGDVNYALKSNFPFYVEQRDLRCRGAHLKPASAAGTATAGGQPSERHRHYGRCDARPGLRQGPQRPCLHRPALGTAPCFDVAARASSATRSGSW